MVFARRVRARRLQADMTQAKLALSAGVTVETVARIERVLRSRSSANSNPSLETMDRLAQALGVPLTDLLTESGGSKPRDSSIAFITSLPKDVRRRVDAVARALAAAG